MKRERLYLLDSIRGFSLINMIAYHALYDVVYIFGHPIAWYESEIGYIWQQSICWCFILLSGACFSLGKHPVRRGATIFAMGCLISIITALVMPQQRVRFGILSFIGIAMIITQLLVPLLKKIPPFAGLLGSLFLFLMTKLVPSGAFGIGDYPLILLPTALYQNKFLYPLGFPYSGFFSSDYFSLIPWIFLYWTGVYLSFCGKKLLSSKVFYQKIPSFHWVGQYSLWIYMVHQPVVYGALLVLHTISK